MFKPVAALMSAALAITPLVAFAADEPTSSGTAAKQKVADGDQKICRNGKPTGTRMVTRICKTRAEWDEIRDRTQRSIDGAMSRSQVEIGRDDYQRTF